MFRVFARAALMAAVTLSAASAATPLFASEKHRHAGSEEPRSEHAHREEGLESIANEVAEVGPEGTEQDGMSRNMQEMIDAENTDGCDGVFSQVQFDGC